MTCAARQYNDQMCCGRCSLQWDVNDPEPPVCGRVPQEARVSHTARREYVAFIREVFNVETVKKMKSQMPEIIKALMTELSRHAHPMSLEGMPKCAPTGSRVICNPPVMNTDNDWLVYVPESLQGDAMVFLESRGATHSEKQETYPDGVCYRYGEVNPILIWDHTIFYRWVAATYWAAKLNLQDKAERTFLFAALVDQSVPIDSLVL